MLTRVWGVANGRQANPLRYAARYRSDAARDWLRAASSARSTGGAGRGRAAHVCSGCPILPARQAGLRGCGAGPVPSEPAKVVYRCVGRRIVLCSEESGRNQWQT